MVEWKKLGEVCIIKTGKLNANAQVDGGEYPFFTCDKNSYRTDTYAFDCDALILAGNGNIGNVKHFCGKFNAYQRTSLNVAISSICHKIFDRLSHAGRFLNLVKYDD